MTGSAGAKSEPYSTRICCKATAERYSQFRPQYPQQVYDIILEHLGPEQRKLAVDVATGSGQAAVQLAAFFQQVVATDGNVEQLRHAKLAPNVTYKISDAHSIQLPNGCADLITAASALHWFEHDRFYRETRRVLKPHGVVAAWAIPLGCAVLEVPSAPGAAAACNAALHHIHEDILGPCWDERKRWADKMYKGIEPSSEHFSTVKLMQLDFPVELTADALVGYASSWSAYSIYRKQQPGMPDPLTQYRQQLLAALEAEGTPADITIVAHIPLCMIFAQHPKPLSSSTS
ncbi:S-adenosyl-L-methionine-dependent methyltransferase [Scenedesmus sp. NREL 46B-D3]|nr:S-adenosyl-L-methionine-dependent methyltransferase [Scenedesmus sp. NREL 46B-D3]